MTSDPTTRRMWPTPQLIRAARGLVNIDQGTLAAVAGVSRKAVISLEGDESETMDYRRLVVLQKLRRALEEKWGIEFVQEVRSSRTGVVLRKTQRKPFRAQHYRRLGLREIVTAPWIVRCERTAPCSLLRLKDGDAGGRYAGGRYAVTIHLPLPISAIRPRTAESVHGEAPVMWA